MGPAPILQGDKELNKGGLSEAELVSMGERLWKDKALSRGGALACSTCHVNNYGAMKGTFANPYPHCVEMPKRRFGVDQVTAAEMVHVCMLIPMQNDPLPWDSVELAALVQYVLEIQKGFKASKADGNTPNPCNPCGLNACNPCPANPCSPGAD